MASGIRVRVRVGGQDGRLLSADLATFEGHLWQAVNSGLPKAGEIATEEARRLAPKKTGRLQSAIGYKLFSAFSTNLGFKTNKNLNGFSLIINPRIAPHGNALQYGRESWEITPKQANFLHFIINGKRVFARKVTHPAVEGQNFLGRGLEAAVPRIKFVLQGLVETAWKRGNPGFIKGGR